MWLNNNALYKHIMLLSRSFVSNSLHPMDYNPPGSSVHGMLHQEYWSGLPFPSPGELPDTGINLGSPALQADSLPSKPPRKQSFIIKYFIFNCKHNAARVINVVEYLSSSLTISLE